MMHNSLWIRKRLRDLNRDPLHVSRRDPHRSAGWEGDAKAGKGEIALEGVWSVVGKGTVTGISELARDLEDFLGKAGVAVSPNGANEIMLSIGGQMRWNEYALSVGEALIEISAGGIEGLWSGAVRLEREMGIRRGAILPAGEMSGSPSWDHQISQSPWGSNYLVPDLGPEYLGDDAFRLLAHHGVNGMTIYGDALLYVQSDILPELNHSNRAEYIRVLREATERAQNYGVSLYWVPVLPKLRGEHQVFMNHPEVRGARLGWIDREDPLYTLCSTSAESLAFFAEFFSRIFEEVPLLGGLILIVGGESFYHCYMRPDLKDIRPGQRKTNCPRCSTSSAEEVVAGFVGNVSQAVHGVKSEAVVVAWPYSGFIWSEDFNQLGLAERLPLDSGLLSEIDKDHFLKRRGYTKRIWDYSVDFTGPSDRIVLQAGACRSRGLPLFVKSETALGLEAIHMPYVPCINRLWEKWGNVAALGPSGVLQSWMFFGMWGSRAEELGWWRRWCPGREDPLSLIAKRDFGGAWQSVLDAWGLLSRAVGHLPCIPPYFIGPWFLGPAHPLALDRAWEPGREFEGALYFLQEREESLSKAMLDVWSSLVLTELPENPSSWEFRVEEGTDAWPAFISEVEKAVDLSAEALCLMNSAKDQVGGRDALRVREEALAFEFFHRTLLSVLNTVRFIHCRDHLDGDPTGLRAILEDELDNAERSRRLYEEAPWFDLSLRSDGLFPSSQGMLEHKIRLAQGQLR